MNRVFLSKNRVRLLFLFFIMIIVTMSITGCGHNHGNSEKLPDKGKKPETITESAVEENVTTSAVETVAPTVPEPVTPPVKNEINTENNGQITNNVIAHPTNAQDGDVYKTFDNSLFIGDSRTEGFQLYSGVKNATYFCAKAMTIDRIIDGEKIKVQGNKASVYDVLASGEFAKVYISVGLNELGWNHIETFLDDYKSLINAVREKQAGTIIYIQALLPVTSERSAKDKINNNEQIYWYNVNLLELANETGATYINADKMLVDEAGALKAEATTDGIHLKSEYCKIWAQYLAGIS